MGLFEAVKAGDLAALEAELKSTVDVNVLGEGRVTPLIEAARAGWVPGVEALLDAGAEPGWKDAEEETALLKAAANGHVKVVNVLGEFADDEERDLARAFLKAFGSSASPEFHYDESRLKRRAVELAARAAAFVGHDDPESRVSRVERSEKLRKK